jgi:ATP-dependent exoDNAse (exonuclease V) beta subunit
MSEMQYRVYSWLDVYVLVQQIYGSLKRASRVIDYTDIELIARDFLLDLTDYRFFRSRLETGIRYVLIDEFQDTSELQWSALRPLIDNCVRGGGTLFYVGDAKQSIYRWRGGEPYLFNRAREEFGMREERLPYSYRQNRVLLDFVNDVFGLLSGETDGRFLYVDQHLPPTITDKERGFVCVRGVDGDEELVTEVCEQIRILEHAGVAVDDIAILCRTNREVSVIEALLRNEGITFNSAGRTRLLDDFCVRDMLNVIGFVLHPGETLYLAGLLRAPFFRSSFARLDELSGKAKESTLQQLKTQDPALWERVQAILRLARYTSISTFILRLYRELDVFAVYPAKREALMAFLELAYDFESNRENARLMNFYRYLQDNVQYITLSAGDHGGITVQTIHSAKGLEYHTVILPFLKQRFHASLDGSLMYSRDGEGKIGSLAIARRSYVDYHANQTEITRLQHENDMDYQTDEINTLYVALTRARENLVILPSVSVNGESVGKVLMRITCTDSDTGGTTELRVGEIVPSSGEGKKREKEFVQTRPIEMAIEPEEAVMRDQEEVFSDVERRDRREGLLRGTLFHAVIERIMSLPLAKGEIDSLLAAAAAREAKGYAKDEVRKAMESVRSMVVNVTSDSNLKKYFTDKAAGELNVFSERYQNLVGRIDRIYLGDEIDVIDFKTNPIRGDEELERLIEVYREQVDAYCSIVAEIFPDRKVRGYLYFTDAAESRRLVELGRKT